MVCHCHRHSKNCGCLSEAFLKQAKINHFCCLSQAKSPEQYAQTLRDLGMYHARDVHSWEGGSCSFHSPRKCACGKCEAGTELLCAGELYKSKNRLTCPFHALCYQVVLSDIADDAKQIVHTVMLRGNSNGCESKFNVVTRYRSKDKALEQRSYQLYTDIGLLQANITWARNAWGGDYHWMVALLSKFDITPTPAMLMCIRKLALLRARDLARKKSRECMDARNSRKRARLEEQEERKKWTKRQKVIMTYGGEDDTHATAIVCKSCGKEGHKRSSSQKCENYKKV